MPVQANQVVEASENWTKNAIKYVICIFKETHNRVMNEQVRTLPIIQDQWSITYVWE